MENRMYGIPGRERDRDQRFQRSRLAARRGYQSVDPLLWPEGYEDRITDVRSYNRAMRELEAQFENFQEWPEEEWRTAMSRGMSRSGYPATGGMLAQAGSNQQNTAMPPTRFGYLPPRPGVRGFYFPGQDFSDNSYTRSARSAGVEPNRDTIVSRPSAMGHEQYHRLQSVRGLHYDSQLLEDINQIVAKHGGEIRDGFGQELIPHLITPGSFNSAPDSVKAKIGIGDLPEGDRLRIVQAVENYLQRSVNSADYERADRTLPGANNMYGRPSYR